VIAGEVVLEGGRLCKVDEAELIANAKMWRQRVLEELG
jgi:hypothetical protein